MIYMMSASPLFSSVQTKRKFVYITSPASVQIQSCRKNLDMATEPAKKKPKSNDSDLQDAWWDDDGEEIDDMELTQAAAQVENPVESRQPLEKKNSNSTSTSSISKQYLGSVSTAAVSTSMPQRFLGRGMSKSRSMEEKSPSQSTLGTVDKSKLLVKKQLVISDRCTTGNNFKSSPKLSGLSEKLHKGNPVIAGQSKNAAKNMIYSAPAVKSLNSGNASESSALYKKLELAQAEMESYKTELNKLKEIQYGKDGQIKILKDNLKAKDIDLQKQRHENIQMTELESKERSEREKQLETELERLQTQLAFKEAEIVQDQSHKKKPSHDSEQNSIHRSESSPVHHQSPQRPTYNSKSNFPTALTFLAGQKSPSSKPAVKKTDKGVQVIIGSCESATSLSSSQSHELKKRDHKLCVANSKGAVSGPHLVGQMMGASTPNSLSKVLGHNLLGVLQPDTLQKPSSPQPNKSCPSKLTATPTTCTSASSSGDDEQDADLQRATSLAWEAFQSLLDLVPSLSAGCSLPLLHTDYKKSLLFLPAIEHQLDVYLRSIEASIGVESSGGSEGCSREVTSNSVVSVTCSMDKLAIQHTQHLQLRTIQAFNNLLTLVLYNGEACHAILQPNKALGAQKAHASPATESYSGTAVNSNLIIDSHVNLTVQNCNLLPKLLQLANITISQNLTSGGKVPEMCLTVLGCVLQRCEIQYLKSIPLTTLCDCLLNCMEEDVGIPGTTRYHLLQQTISILSALARDRTLIAALCTTADDCVLCSLSHCLTHFITDLSSSQTTCLGEQTIQLFSSVIADHCGGGTLLVETNCPCSVEVVKCLVHILHRELLFYQKLKGANCTDPLASTNYTDSLRLLRCGTLLLQQMVLCDRLFVRRQHQGEPVYTELMYGLYRVFHKAEGATDPYDSAVHGDLWLWDDPPEDSADDEVSGSPAADNNNFTSETRPAVKRASELEDPKYERKEKRRKENENCEAVGGRRNSEQKREENSNGKGRHDTAMDQDVVLID